MKKFCVLIALVCPLSLAYQMQGKVIHVTDGDTVTLLDDSNTQHKIRLYGIDAPERKQPYGRKATDMLVGMVKGKRITADCRERDRYKRHVCTLYLGGQDINAEMVRLGGAWVYRKYYKGTAYYALQEEARAEKRGLWATSEYQAIPPWEWRKRKQ